MRRAFPLILALAVLLPAGVGHASAADVIRDCTNNGRLDRSYSQKELRSAIANLPSDVDEYTNCREVIRNAQLAGGSGSATPTDPAPPVGGDPTDPTDPAAPPTENVPGPFGGFSEIPADPVAAATPQEREALAAAQASPAAAQATELASTPLPTAVIVALAVGALGLLILLALDLRRRVVARGE